MSVDSSEDSKTVVPLHAADSDRYGDNFDWPDFEKAAYYAELSLTYYLKYFEMVKEKLSLAKQATEQSGHDAQVNFYAEEWERILNRYVHNGATEADLAKIEDILVTIPGTIKQHYDALIAQSDLIRDIMEELAEVSYRKALQVAQHVQSQPNPMSGLTPEEYIEEEKRLSAAAKGESGKTEAFKIIVKK